MTREAISKAIAPVGTRSHFIGAALTGIYVLGMGTLVAARWEDFAKLELNALGDFLAGAFGPIAFLWLVLGYMQQGRELRVNSEALRLQAEELANSVEQQQQIAEATKKQLSQFLENHRAILDLDFNLLDIDHRHSIFNMEMILSNYGYRCTQILLVLPPCSRQRKSTHFQIEASHVVTLDTNQQHKEFIAFHMPPELVEENITIKFRDGTGEMATKNFKITKDASTFNLIKV